MKETKKNENDIVLAPEDGLFERAAEIAGTTVEDEKLTFDLQHDANPKELLLSVMEALGAVVVSNGVENHTMTVSMNMEQLKLIKSLECVERIKTDEGINPFLEEEAAKLIPAPNEEQVSDVEFAALVENATPEIQASAFEMNAMSDVTSEASIATMTIAEASEPNNNVAFASVAAPSRSSCCPCPSNTSMATAAEISDESYTSGNICCPGAEQWFRFTATRTGQYTICTTGSLDTIGTLYDCCGNQIVEVDDYAPCGKLNFRIIQNLSAGATYYVKVRVYGGNTGNYTLRVTEMVFADYVTINQNTIILEKDVLYELPITPNYTYKAYNGARPIPGLSVSISPSNANEQKIWWWEQYGSILTCSYGWDDDGDRYIHVTATGTGTAKLYAEDWNEIGKRDECTININSMLIYRTRNRERLGFYDSSDNNDITPITAEDLTYGDKSTQTLIYNGTSISGVLSCK